MTENKASNKMDSELRTKGILEEKGVLIGEKSNIDELQSRGYGTVDEGKFRLAFYESLYLLDKEMLEVKDTQENEVNFKTLLQHYEAIDENVWVNYLVYRDLRSRGYVVREGFGIGINFRMYDRGAYGKDTASYLILGTQEGKPLTTSDLADALQRCLSQKKELILAVMNRRGEIVYYSVSQLTFK